MLGVEGARRTPRRPSTKSCLATCRAPGTSRRPYDLLDGLLGLGVYGVSSPEGRLPLVERTVQRLVARNQIAAEGLAWHTPPQSGDRNGFPEGHFNLGLAHGVAGVIAFLAGAMEEGSNATRLARCWLTRVHWLLADSACRTPAGRAPFLGPSLPGGHRRAQGLADFQGGPTRMRALPRRLPHAASAVLGDADLLEEALSVAAREAARMDVAARLRHPGYRLRTGGLRADLRAAPPADGPAAVFPARCPPREPSPPGDAGRPGWASAGSRRWIQRAGRPVRT